MDLYNWSQHHMLGSFYGPRLDIILSAVVAHMYVGFTFLHISK